MKYICKKCGKESECEKIPDVEWCDDCAYEHCFGFCFSFKEDNDKWKTVVLDLDDVNKVNNHE